MVAMTRLPVDVVAFASSEIDKTCKRLVRVRWPGVIELGAVEKIDAACLQKLALSIGYRLDLVLCGAASPSQDLDHRVLEISRVIKLLEETFILYRSSSLWKMLIAWARKVCVRSIPPLVLRQLTLMLCTSLTAGALGFSGLLGTSYLKKMRSWKVTRVLQSGSSQFVGQTSKHG